MQTKTVIDLGFGDSGKGKTVSSLCMESLKKSNIPLVVRFSGGHQAGHTVRLEDGTVHVFSNFGSGTLQAVDTYWSEFCTMDPIGILNEYVVLKPTGKKLGRLYIDADCPITTPFEKAINCDHELTNKHGTCGVGFGATWQREEDHYHLRAKDLLFPNILKTKINLLKQHYSNYCLSEEEIDFFVSCDKLLDIVKVVFDFKKAIQYKYNEVIYEGSQGLLLDAEIGFFPHVTRSNTGTRNIISLALTKDPGDVYLVTRAYSTRHGNGPLLWEGVFRDIPRNSYESNKDYGVQGIFRQTVLDIDCLRYAYCSDNWINSFIYKCSLVVTCLDVMQETNYPYVYKGKLNFANSENNFISMLKEIFPVKNIYISKTPKTEQLELFI